LRNGRGTQSGEADGQRQELDIALIISITVRCGGGGGGLINCFVYNVDFLTWVGRLLQFWPFF